MSLLETMKTSAEAAMEFTPKQLEAQEAMGETGRLVTEDRKETGENTPEYWEEKADKELDENGDSDAYREFTGKAKELGTPQGNTKEISFGGGYSGGHSEKYWKEKAVKEKLKGSQTGYDWAKKNLEWAIEDGAKKEIKKGEK